MNSPSICVMFVLLCAIVPSLASSEDDDRNTREHLSSMSGPSLPTGFRELSFGLSPDDDFADLAFLEQILAKRRFVLLGESAHGVGDFGILKTRLTKFLHSRLGFEVIALEAPISSCAVADGMVGKRQPSEILDLCVYRAAAMDELVSLFEYVEGTRASDRPLTIAGIDPQDYTAALPIVWESRFNALAHVDQRLAVSLNAAQASAKDWLQTWVSSSGENLPTEADLNNAAEAFLSAATRIGQSDRLGPHQHGRRELLTADLAGRGRLLASLRLTIAEQMSVRNSIMADNLETLLDSVYPGKKVIVWAHNVHIEQSRIDKKLVPSMGTLLSDRIGREGYGIGFVFGEGRISGPQRSSISVDRPTPGSLEEVLARFGRALVFTETRDVPGNAWAVSRMKLRGFGGTSYTYELEPASAFNAVIYISSVSPGSFSRGSSK